MRRILLQNSVLDTSETYWEQYEWGSSERFRLIVGKKINGILEVPNLSSVNGSIRAGKDNTFQINTSTDAPYLIIYFGSSIDGDSSGIGSIHFSIKIELLYSLNNKCEFIGGTYYGKSNPGTDSSGLVYTINRSGIQVNSGGSISTSWDITKKNTIIGAIIKINNTENLSNVTYKVSDLDYGIGYHSG